MKNLRGIFLPKLTHFGHEVIQERKRIRKLSTSECRRDHSRPRLDHGNAEPEATGAEELAAELSPTRPCAAHVLLDSLQHCLQEGVPPAPVLHFLLMFARPQRQRSCGLPCRSSSASFLAILAACCCRLSSAHSFRHCQASSPGKGNLASVGVRKTVLCSGPAC